MSKIQFIRSFLLPLFLLSGYGQVAAVNPFETIVLSTEVLPDDFGCNLPAPTGVNTVATTINSIAIAWNAIPSASAYHVKAVTNIGSTIFDGPVPTPAVSVVTDPGITVTFTISAICSSGEQSLNETTYSEITDFVLIEDLTAAFPGNPTTTPFNCNDQFPLSGADGSELYFSANKISAGQKAVFKLHMTTVQAVGLQNSPDPVHFTFRDEHNNYPTGGGSLEASEIHVFYGQTQVLTVNITKVLNTVNANVHICVTPNTITGDYEILRLTTGRPRSMEDVLPATITLSPNPFTDDFTLTLPEISTENTTVRILDLNGKTVVTETITAGNSTQTIPTGDLAPGIYFASITSASGVQTYKIVKAK